MLRVEPLDDTTSNNLIEQTQERFTYEVKKKKNRSVVISL